MTFNYPSFGAPVPGPGIPCMPPMGPMPGPGFGQPAGPSAQMPQGPQTAPQGMISSASRIVANREEANAVPADFGGNLMLFPDLTHNRVYVKRWNMQTGSADFLEFVPAPPPAPPAPPEPPYDAKKDVADLWAEIRSLRAELEKQQRLAAPSKGGKRNDPDE